MIKSTALAFLTVALLATSSALAGDKACCVTASSKPSKEACVATFSKLGLTAAQNSKMETLADDCAKSGCNKESMDKMEAGAKGVLSKEQFVAWKTNCNGMTAEKKQS
ncbi:MAG: hypothetical protein ACR2HH_09155 [Chthoniobacterales bacterium]